jgi:hypothetical protein
VLIGERRNILPEVGVSSSNVRAEWVPVGFLIEIARGVAVLVPVGNAISPDEDLGTRIDLFSFAVVSVGVDGGLGEADADTLEVFGSLAVALKGLNNHDGANFDAKEEREALESLRTVWGAWSLLERVVEVDLIEDWDGDTLSALVVIWGVLSETSSGGRCRNILLGLSSIGGILEMTDVLWEAIIDRRSDR